MPTMDLTTQADGLSDFPNATEVYGNSTLTNVDGTYMYFKIPGLALAMRILIAIGATIGNSVIISGLYLMRKSWKESFTFILNVCIYDLLIGFLLIPGLLITRNVRGYQLGASVYCHIQGIAEAFLNIVEPCGIMLMAFDRFIYIKTPLRYYNIMTPRLAIGLAVVTALANFIYSVCLYRDWKMPVTGVCVSSLYLPGFQIFLYFIIVLVVVLLTLLFNISIGMIALQHLSVKRRLRVASQLGFQQIKKDGVDTNSQNVPQRVVQDRLSLTDIEQQPTPSKAISSDSIHSLNERDTLKNTLKNQGNKESSYIIGDGPNGCLSPLKGSPLVGSCKNGRTASKKASGKDKIYESEWDISVRGSSEIARSDVIIREDCESRNIKPEEVTSQTVTGKASSGSIISNDILPERVLSEDAVLERVRPERMEIEGPRSKMDVSRGEAADRAILEEHGPNGERVWSERIMSENVELDRVTPVRVMTERVTSGRVTPERVTPVRVTTEVTVNVNKAQKKITRMLVIAISIFLFSYFPNMIFRFLVINYSWIYSDIRLFWVSNIWYINCAINPFVYLFFYPDFRAVFKRSNKVATTSVSGT